MKRYLKLLFAASIITLFNACETDVYDPEKIENTKDLVARRTLTGKPPKA